MMCLCVFVCVRVCVWCVCVRVRVRVCVCSCSWMWEQMWRALPLRVGIRAGHPLPFSWHLLQVGTHQHNSPIQLPTSLSFSLSLAFSHTQTHPHTYTHTQNQFISPSPQAIPHGGQTGMQCFSSTKPVRGIYFTLAVCSGPTIIRGKNLISVAD